MRIPAKLCKECQAALQSIYPQPIYRAGSLVEDSAGHTHEEERSLQNIWSSSNIGCPICRWLLAHVFHTRKKKGQILSSDDEKETHISWSCYRKGSRIDLGLSFGPKLDPTHQLSKLELCLTPLMQSANPEWTARNIPSYTGSDKALALAQNWVTTCGSHHTLCNSGRSRRWRPSRLVKVEKTTHGKICASLQESRFEEFGYGVSYLALSHRWLHHEPLRLCMSNIESLRQSIPLQRLKRSIRDAMKIAVRFSIPYLWVDTLCIIQDDARDRNGEIPQMDNIYANAYCTIAASDAETAEEGCFFTRDPLMISAFIIQIDPKLYDGEHLLRRGWNHRDIDDTPLAQRAWFFQERFLSPRIIHYTKMQMHWECRELKVSEAYADGVPERHRNLPGFLFDFHSAGSVLNHANVTMDRKKEFLKTWPYILDKYASMALTFQEDRLNAILGVVKFCESICEDEYAAGIWKADLPHALLWDVLGKEHRTLPSRNPPTVAPSWSWASVAGPTTAYKNDLPVIYHASIAEVPKAENQHVTIKKYSAFNAETTFTIHLRGALIEATLEQGPENLLVLSLPGTPFESKRNNHKVLFRQDTSEVVPSQVLCLPLLSEYTMEVDGDVECQRGLVLEPASEGMYRRIGTWQTQNTLKMDWTLHQQDVVLC